MFIIVYGFVGNPADFPNLFRAIESGVKKWKKDFSFDREKDIIFVDSGSLARINPRRHLTVEDLITMPSDSARIKQCLGVFFLMARAH